MNFFGVPCVPHSMADAGATIGTWFAISYELLYDWRNPAGPGSAQLFIEHVPAYAEIYYRHQSASKAAQQNYRKRKIRASPENKCHRRSVPEFEHGPRGRDETLAHISCMGLSEQLLPVALTNAGVGAIAKAVAPTPVVKPGGYA